MSELRDTPVPECRCPFCDKSLGAAMAGDPSYPNATPSPGDATICIACASVLIFCDDLTVRAPRPGEIEPTPALLRVQAAVRSLDRRNMR